MDSPLKNLPLGIGLRLSARAAAELLETPHAAETLKSWLVDQGARVETLNGFPYGHFHGQRVKERVFQPDWTTPERFEYTCNLFRILALIGDEQADRLTVSTLPASHSWFHADEERIFSRLDAMSGFLDVLGRQTGRLMQLGLEPEPFGHFTIRMEPSVFQRPSQPFPPPRTHRTPPGADIRYLPFRHSPGRAGSHPLRLGGKQHRPL